MTSLIDVSKPMVHAEMADIIGVTRQAVSAAVAEGRIPDNVSLGEALRAYCHRLREQAAGRLGTEVGPLDLAQERAALARSQREGHDLKNAVVRGEYAPVELLASVLAVASQSVVERLDQLPARLARTCPELPTAAREQVMAAIGEARNAWVSETEKLVAQAIAQPDDGPESAGPEEAAPC